ncbi:hypothetical protein FNJ08_22645, partial [Salmonella enterica subsp. salamae]|nr:hypothetical protein [Salmonella enterica subsp. salamae]
YQLRFGYDVLGRLTRLHNEKGEAYRFEYDARDRLTKETGLTGVEKTYQRDALGRLLAQTETPAGGGAALVIRLEYDALGRRTASITASRRTEYQYELQKTTLRDITADGTTELCFEYDK